MSPQQPSPETTPGGTGTVGRRYEIGLPGRALLSWGLAGGIIAGGFIPGTAAVLQRASASTGLAAVAFLFVLGAAAGVFHGGLIGFIGRRTGRTRAQAYRSIFRGLMLFIPGCAIAFIATTWIAMSGMALSLEELSIQAGSAAGWAIGIVICAWAALEGWRAFRATYDRWNESALGTVLLSATFAVLAFAFTRSHPEIWGTNVRVVGVGAVILALGATVWIALPVVAVGLHLVRGRRRTASRDPQ